MWFLHSKLQSLQSFLLMYIFLVQAWKTWIQQIILVSPLTWTLFPRQQYDFNNDNQAMLETKCDWALMHNLTATMKYNLILLFNLQKEIFAKNICKKLKFYFHLRKGDEDFTLILDIAKTPKPQLVIFFIHSYQVLFLFTFLALFPFPYPNFCLPPLFKPAFFNRNH